MQIISGNYPGEEKENPNGDEDTLINIKYGKLTSLQAPYVLKPILKVKMAIFIFCFITRLLMIKFREHIIATSNDMKKWKILVSNFHYLIEFMTFNSSLLDASFQGVIIYQFKFYKVRTIERTSFLLVVIFLLFSMLYLLQMLMISCSVKYSLILNKLCLPIFTNLAKHKKFLAKRPREVYKLKEEYKVYKHLLTNIDSNKADTLNIAKRNDLSESQMEINLSMEEEKETIENGDSTLRENYQGRKLNKIVPVKKAVPNKVDKKIGNNKKPERKEDFKVSSSGKDTHIYKELFEL